MDDAPRDLTDDPHALAEAARLHLRRLFLSTKVAVSGANFAIAETGGLLRRRVRGQRPDVPDAARHADHGGRDREARPDLAGPRGVPPAAAALLDRRADEPVQLGVDRRDCRRRTAAVHIVLLDNGRRGRSRTRPAARRCAASAAPPASTSVPVYERTGGHAYGATYPGPIGAILTPLLVGVEHAPQLPFASVAVRRLLRGVPGRDRHPDRAGQAPARCGQGRSPTEHKTPRSPRRPTR